MHLSLYLICIFPQGIVRIILLAGGGGGCGVSGSEGFVCEIWDVVFGVQAVGL